MDLWKVSGWVRVVMSVHEILGGPFSMFKWRANEQPDKGLSTSRLTSHPLR